MSPSAFTIPPHAIVARAPDLLMVEVDGETVLMSVEKGSYFGLAQTAQDIWIKLETKTEVANLCASLASAYDGEAKRIESETLVFLHKMVEAGLIVVE